MSRSRKKHSFHGITTSISDKWYKKLFHRKERARVRDKINQRDFDGLEIELPYDDWASSKEGKIFFDKREFPELMRK